MVLRCELQVSEGWARRGEAWAWLMKCGVDEWECARVEAAARRCSKTRGRAEAEPGNGRLDDDTKWQAPGRWKEKGVGRKRGKGGAEEGQRHGSGQDAGVGIPSGYLVFARHRAPG